MDLDSIIIENLDVLTSLDEKDNLILYENSLNINNETDFQDLNSNDIKNVIITTLLYCLYHDSSLRFKDRILDRIDISISNIYENIHMNELLQKDDFFSEYIKSIDDMHTLEVQKYQKNKCNRFFYQLNDSFTLFCDNLISFSKKVIEVQSMINGVILINEETEISNNEFSNDEESDAEEYDKKEN